MHTNALGYTYVKRYLKETILLVTITWSEVR